MYYTVYFENDINEFFELIELQDIEASENLLTD